MHDPKKHLCSLVFLYYYPSVLSQHAAAMAEGTKHHSHFPRWITLTFILVDNKYIKSM